jgi:hypothetical protein
MMRINYLSGAGAFIICTRNSTYLYYTEFFSEDLWISYIVIAWCLVLLGIYNQE